jgi:hypothetical protein
MQCGNMVCTPHNKVIFISIFNAMFTIDRFRRREYLCCVATLLSDLTEISTKIKRLLKFRHAEFFFFLFLAWRKLRALISIPFCHIEFNCNRVFHQKLRLDRNFITLLFQNLLLKFCYVLHVNATCPAYLIRPWNLIVYGAA